MKILDKKENIEKIGKKRFLSDDNTLAGKLIYLGGIKDFDKILENKFQTNINAVIHIARYPKGIAISIHPTNPYC